MSVLHVFSNATSAEQEQHACEGTLLVMFSESENLSLGLLTNRRMQDGMDVFKDIELQANRHTASLALRFDSDQPPYMHIDKTRRKEGQGFIYKLRQENEAVIVRDTLWDIYDIARDRISIMLGEPLFDATPHYEHRRSTHLQLVSL